MTFPHVFNNQPGPIPLQYLDDNFNYFFTGSGASQIGTMQTGTGAVLRNVQTELNDVIKVKQFGAIGDGVVDDTAAIQAAIDAIVTGAKPRTLQFEDASTYKVTATLYRDVSLVGIDFNGATLDLSGVSSGPGMLHASSGSFGVSGCQPLPIRHGKIAGNSTSGSVAFQYGTTTNVHGLISTANVAGFSLDHISFINADIAEDYVTRCFDITHIACEYEQCGASTAVLRCLSGGTNYGENLVYAAGCAFHNSGTVLKQDYVSSQFNFSQCTFDYCAQYFNVNNGFCISTNCYFEWSNDTAIQFLAANDALIVIENPIMSVTGPRVNFDIFQSNTNNPVGFNKGQGLKSGIFVRGGTIGFQNATTRRYLCTGTGAYDFKGVDYSGYALSQSSINAIGTYTNKIFNGAFTSNIAGWTVTGSASWNSTGGVSGDGSLKLVYDQATNAYIEFPATGGDSPIVTYDITLSGVTSRFVGVHLIAYDITGIQLADSYIGSSGFDLFTGTFAYVTKQTRYCSLPAGTVKCRFYIEYTGGPINNTYITNIDNVVVNVC